MNDWALAEAASASERLLAFCGVPWASWAPEEIARCGEQGARGLKLHQVHAKVSLQDDVAANLLDAMLVAAGEAQIPVLIHVAMDDADEVRAFFALVAKHPDVTVIAAHQIAQSLALLPEAPDNLWIEVSGLPHAPPTVGAAFVPIWKTFGLERVLLGSDHPYLTPKAHLERLQAYPLSDEERQQIVTGNPARLFGLQ